MAFRFVGVVKKVQDLAAKDTVNQIEFDQSELKDAKNVQKGQDIIKTWLSSILGLDKAATQQIVEAHMKEKCLTKSEAERKFKADIRMMLIYTAFIVLFSYSATTSGTETLNVRNMIQPQITGPFSNILSTADMYTYLEAFIIPAVTSGGLFTTSGNVMMTPVLPLEYGPFSEASTLVSSFAPHPARNGGDRPC
jgi:hypothetical protein